MATMEARYYVTMCGNAVLAAKTRSEVTTYSTQPDSGKVEENIINCLSFCAATGDKGDNVFRR